MYVNNFPIKLEKKMKKVFSFGPDLFFFFFFFAMPTSCGSSWTRDQTHATTATQATAMTIPDPWPAEPQENSPIHINSFYNLKFPLPSWASICQSVKRNHGKDVQKREHLYTVSGNVNWYKHYGKQYRGSLNIKNKTTTWSSNSTSAYMSKGNKVTTLKRYGHPHVHCSTIYNN